MSTQSSSGNIYRAKGPLVLGSFSTASSRVASTVLCLILLLCTPHLPTALKYSRHIEGTKGTELENVSDGEGHYIPTTRFYHFDIHYTNKTVNCVNKALLLVNGQFPGPSIYAVEGDRIVVDVMNHANTNITIHWHGVEQRLTAWQDGTAYITQCPLRPGDYFTYNFTVAGQRGTFFWHAHTNWQRATVHGAIVVYPSDFSYPFRTPADEFPVVIGEWWNADVEQVEMQGLLSGAAFAKADAVVINGLPGPKYNCSASEGISTIQVSPRKTYLLRVINAALNTELFFQVANHSLTVVEADSDYVSPFETSTIFLAPGQTVNVLVTTHDLPANTAFFMAAKSLKSQVGTDYLDFTPAQVKWAELDLPLIAASALMAYITNRRSSSGGGDTTAATNSIIWQAVHNPNAIPFPVVPRSADVQTAQAFEDELFTLLPEKVPQSVDRHLFYVVGISSLPCVVPPQNCTYRVAASINNVTFSLPTTALLQAAYFGIPGVFTTDLPDYPTSPFNYTYPLSPPLAAQISLPGTRVSVIKYGQTVQLVLQDTMISQFENHPFHLHGYSFYVIGRGTGNFNSLTSPATFNTYNPPLRFTVDVPSRGWVVIRFTALNPGMWLFHCHLDKHVSWGMQTAFYVLNGAGVDETLSPPPSRLTAC